MKRMFTLVAMMMMVVGMMAGPAVARQETPGTPGESQCMGQTTAWLAQAAHTYAEELGSVLPVVPNPGIGNVAAFFNVEVQFVHELIETYCDPEVELELILTPGGIVIEENDVPTGVLIPGRGFVPA